MKARKKKRILSLLLAAGFKLWDFAIECFSI